MADRIAILGGEPYAKWIERDGNAQCLFKAYRITEITLAAIVAFEIATPYTPRDYQNALTAWLQGRHDVWQSRIDAYEANPTDENLATIRTHNRMIS